MLVTCQITKEKIDKSTAYCEVVDGKNKYYKSKEIYDKYKEKQELDQKLADLKDKEAELRVDVDKLQDPDYIARYAREKYLYSKNGEKILKID